MQISHQQSVNKSLYLLVFLLLLTLCAVVDFTFVSAHGLIADDWGRISHHFYKTEHLQKYPIPYPLAACLKNALFDGRPMLTTTLLLEWVLFEIGGRVLLSLFGGFVLALNAQLIFVLATRHLPFLHSFAISAAIICYPADTTHQWLTLACGRLGYTMAIVACLFLAQGRKAFAVFALLMSMMTYEPTALIFLAAPWLSYGGGRTGLKPTAQVAGIAFGFWAIQRIVFTNIRPIQGTLAGSANDDVARTVTSTADFLSYISSFAEVYWIALIKWFWEPLRVLVTWDGAAAFGVGFFALSAMMLLVHRVSMRTQNVVAISTWYNSNHESVRQMRCSLWHALVWGLLLLAISAIPSFRIGPTTEFGPHSRGNYLLAIAVAMIIVAIAGFAMEYFQRCSYRLAVAMILISTIASWGATRFTFQKIYVYEIDVEKAKIAELLQSMERVDHNAVFFVDNRSVRESSIVPMLEALADWELQALLRCAYGPQLTPAKSSELAFVHSRNKRQIVALNMVDKAASVVFDPDPNGATRKAEVSRFLTNYLKETLPNPGIYIQKTN